MNKDALVLLSGGIDSAACAWFLRDHGYSVRGVFVDYGSSHVGQRRGQPRRIRAVLRHQSRPCLGYFAGLCSARAGLVLGRKMAGKPYACFALSRPVWTLRPAIRLRGPWDLHLAAG